MSATVDIHDVTLVVRALRMASEFERLRENGGPSPASMKYAEVCDKFVALQNEHADQWHDFEAKLVWEIPDIPHDDAA